jgi:hypothetical protein
LIQHPQRIEMARKPFQELDQEPRRLSGVAGRERFARAAELGRLLRVLRRAASIERATAVAAQSAAAGRG